MARERVKKPTPWLDPHGEAPVVGSLAVNPADNALWMATNTGLFRVGDVVGGLSGQAQVQVSADGRRDVAVADGAGRAVRPRGRPHRPPALGRRHGTDEGRTWRPGDATPNADFAWPSAEALYRLDPGGEAMLCRDGGRTFEQVGTTGGEPQEMVAADPMTLYAPLLDGRVLRSGDGGRTWRDHVAA